MFAAFLGDHICKLPRHGCTIITYHSVVVKVEDKGALASRIIRESAIRNMGLLIYKKQNLCPERELLAADASDEMR